VGLPQVPPLCGMKSPHILRFTHVADRLTKSRNDWIGTARPDGRPHSIPRFGDSGSTEPSISQPPAQPGKPATLLITPAVSVHLESGEDVVILQGIAQELILPTSRS